MIYLDSCIVIYALESGDEAGERARLVIDSAGEQLVISPMVIQEAMVGPLRSGDGEAISRMDSFLAKFDLVELALPAYVHAAELRAYAPSLRTPDALHLAAAKLAGCKELWTNDRRLATASGSFAVDVIGGS